MTEWRSINAATLRRRKYNFNRCFRILCWRHRGQRGAGIFTLTARTQRSRTNYLARKCNVNPEIGQSYFGTVSAYGL
jgi:hypothetical protein